MDTARVTTDDVAVLRRMALFRTLPDAAFQRIAGVMTTLQLPKGRLLFHQGDTASCFYGVVSGWVEVFRDAENGDRAVLGLFTRGETFAEAAMFMGTGFPANARTVSECRLCVFDEPSFGRLLRTDTGICRGMLGSLAQHLHRMTHAVEQLQTRNARQRLAGFLLGLCEERPGRVQIALPFDKTVLAARLGMKPESLSRNFAALRPQGVTVVDHVVTVADTRRLAEYCRNGSLRSRGGD